MPHFDYATCDLDDCDLCAAVNAAQLAAGVTPRVPLSPSASLGDGIAVQVKALQLKLQNDYMSILDVQQYANDGDTQLRDELIQMMVDHALPAAAVAGVLDFDPSLLDGVKADIAALKAVKPAAAVAPAPGAVTGSVNGVVTALTLWVGTKAQYDAITAKDLTGTVYIVQ